MTTSGRFEVIAGPNKLRLEFTDHAHLRRVIARWTNESYDKEAEKEIPGANKHASQVAFDLIRHLSDCMEDHSPE